MEKQQPLKNSSIFKEFSLNSTEKHFSLSSLHEIIISHQIPVKSHRNNSSFGKNYKFSLAFEPPYTPSNE